MASATVYSIMFDEQQAAKTSELAELLEEPRVSATLRSNNYDPSKTKAIYTADLRRKPTPEGGAQKIATRITYSMEERNGKR